MDEYINQDVCIRTPGKFEGQPAWIRDLFYIAMEEGEIVNRDWETQAVDDCSAHKLTVDLDLVLRFPALMGAKQIVFWEDDQGFAHYQLIN